MIKISKYPLIIALFSIIYTNISMALEEPKYEIIKSNINYEIRKYKDRLAVQVEYSNNDRGFQYLFNYISGANINAEKIDMTTPVTQSIKIDMTIPVTQSLKDDKMVMQFFLPSKFTINTAPKPTNERVSLVIIEGGYYAVIRYSGRSTDKNYYKKFEELKKYLKKDKIEIIENGIKATFNGPFTLPPLRRNEAMVKIKWH
jgi:hypothetical protein